MHPWTNKGIVTHTLMIDQGNTKAYIHDTYREHLTNRFHVAMRLFSNRSQMTSKCGKNKKVAHEAQPNLSLMFLPHFDVLCDLLLNRRAATWNLFVLYNKKLKYTEKNSFLFQISPLWQTRLALWRDLLSIQNEANWLVAMLSKELWLVQIQNSKNSKKLESSAVVIYAAVL